MNKKMVCGVLIAFIGLVFSVFCFGYAVINPCIYNGIEGILGDFLGNDLLMPFIISVAVLCVGVAICLIEAYRKDK